MKYPDAHSSAFTQGLPIAAAATHVPSGQRPDVQRPGFEQEAPSLHRPAEHVPEAHRVLSEQEAPSFGGGGVQVPPAQGTFEHS